MQILKEIQLFPRLTPPPLPASSPEILPSERPWLLLVLLAVLGTFLPVLAAGLIWDDRMLLLPEQSVTLFELFFRPYLPAVDRLISPYFRPLPRLSLLLTAGLGGAIPVVQHGLNLLLHLLNTALVMSLTRRMFRTSLLQVLAVGVLFGLHPLHVEPVAWIAGRPDLLATTFCLLAWRRFTPESPIGSSHESASDGPRGGARAPVGARGWLVCAGLLLAGLLSKESAVPMVLVFLAVMGVRPVQDWKKGLLILSLTTGVYLGLRQLALSSMAAQLIHLEGQAWSLRPATAARILLAWVERFFRPGVLCAEWELVRAAQPFELSLGGVLGMTGVLGLWGGRRLALRRSRGGHGAAGEADSAAMIWLGLVSFGLLMLPVLNLVPIDETVAERYGYLPSLGLCLVVAGVLGLIQSWIQTLTLRTQRVGTGLSLLGLGLLTGLLATQTAQGLIPWLSEPLFFAHQVQCAPQSGRARTELGRLRRAAGDLGGAARLWLEAHALAPSDPHPLNLLADLRLKQGALDEALALVTQARALEPSSVPGMLLQGRILMAMQRLPEAEAVMTQAQKQQPDRLETLHDLALVQLKQGKLLPAKEILERLLLLEGPSSEVLNSLGIIAMTQQQTPEGLRLFREAVKRWPETRDGWCNLARALLQAGVGTQAGAGTQAGGDRQAGIARLQAEAAARCEGKP